MSQTTRSPKEFSTNTTTFADNGIVTQQGGRVVRTATKPVALVKVDLGEADVLPAGYVTIDDLIAEVEEDKNEKIGLEDARRWVGKTFYKGEKTLRALRLKQGFSQARLASAIGTTQAHIARVENGEFDVQMSTLTRIAAALHIPHLKVVDAYLNARRAAGVLQE